MNRQDNGLILFLFLVKGLVMIKGEFKMFGIRLFSLDESIDVNFYIIRVIAFFWIIVKIMSWRLWLSYREFPLIPVIEFFKATPAWIHVVMFCSSLVCLGLIIIFPKKLLACKILLLSETISCLLDVNRCQPWEYQYLIYILYYLFCIDRPSVFIKGIWYSLAGIYIYSGIHKLNLGFLESVWGNTILHYLFKIPHHLIHHPIIYYCGFGIAIIEAILGIGLLFLRTRNVSAWVLIAIHGFILVILGPFGINFNQTVWPWNLALIMILFILIYCTQVYKESNHHLVSFDKRMFFIIFLPFWLLPALNFVGKWDYYLSFNLYSGKGPNGIICLNKTNIRLLNTTGKSEFDPFNICKSNHYINVQTWALHELGVCPYPEIWVFKSIKSQIEAKYGDQKNHYYIYSYPYSRSKLIEL